MTLKFTFVTISGKVVVCKYIKNEGTLKYRWENAAVWRDSLGEVIAYREIHVSRDVLDVLDSCKSQKVEYYKSLE